MAQQVALQLTAHNALDAHARDEIGISENTSAQPFRAAFSSAIAFTIGSLFPLLSILLLPEQYLDKGVMLIGVLSLGIMGALASYTGGVSIWKGSARVMLWGVIAMLFSSWIGSLPQCGCSLNVLRMCFFRFALSQRITSFLKQ